MITYQTGLPQNNNSTESLVVGMKLTSPAFENNNAIPIKYTCDGEGISPPLSITGMPPNTQSLALIMEDPDAPGQTFTHWILWNMDSVVKEIPEGTVPPNTNLGINDSGGKNYTPPCPPSSTHHYIFRLYALNKKLFLSEPVVKKELEDAMIGNVLDKTELIGLYGR